MIARIFAAAFLLLLAGPAWADDLPPADVPGALNPDVTQDTIATTICVSGWTKTVRPPVSYTNALKRKLMAAAGIPWSRRSDFELDHRLPLEEGGAPRDPANLWLEPWHGPHNAHQKDALESAIKRDVCAGRMTLEAGRAVFLGDWWPEWEARFGAEETAARR